MTELACSHCLLLGEQVHAITIFDGHAVCRMHLAWDAEPNGGGLTVAEWVERLDRAIDRGWLD